MKTPIVIFFLAVMLSLLGACSSGVNSVQRSNPQADPNYVDSLDGIAFHPYASGLDYLNGIRGLYGRCVDNIRGKLARPRPLWNT